MSPRLIAALKEFARLNEIKVKTLRLKKYIPGSILIFYLFLKIFELKKRVNNFFFHFLNIILTLYITSHNIYYVKLIV